MARSLAVTLLRAEVKVTDIDEVANTPEGHEDLFGLRDGGASTCPMHARADFDSQPWVCR